jgi:hypothetical protein
MQARRHGDVVARDHRSSVHLFTLRSMADYSANAANVNFDFARALAAARQLQELADAVKNSRETWAEKAHNAQADGTTGEWKGGKRDVFDHNLVTARTDAERIESGLRALADKLAQQWARARGQQNRINWARWVQAEKDDDGWAENSWEWVAGEDDYGEPPKNPPDPPGPHYPETHLPGQPVIIKQEFQNRSVNA